MTKCGQCDRQAMNMVTLGNDKRHLCRNHYAQYMTANESHPIVFTKASELDWSEMGDKPVWKQLLTKAEKRTSELG